jgi:predicted metal-dependent TIM-barrel fold hydrolase
LNLNRTLNIISRAWGKQKGYAFFPYIDRKAQMDTGQRRAGYHEGPEDRKRDKHGNIVDPRGVAFRWPNDRAEILKHLEANLGRGHDVYWCPSLFEFPNRRSDLAMDEHALWADLDEVDPREIRDYPPTIAWESSPDRYQALWLADEGDFQGASWPGNENQRLTYLLGADPSGWDTTQLLRLPGWPNYKPERIEANGGTPPKGKLLWSAGQLYTPGDFADLPEVRGAVASELTEAIENEVASVDRLKVISRVKIKLNHTARELLNAREVTGDRSAQMWYLMRCLADAGCTTTEIVAVVEPTVWNKFAGRADEMKRLISEASKAVASRSDEIQEQIEEESDRKKPGRLGDMLRNIKRPVWLVEGVLTEGACGFVAGEPKSWKSWVAYDLALSVSTGADFLGAFAVRAPGPVLYIQEEDPLPTLKTRGAKIWSGKSVDKLELDSDGGIYWLPSEHEREFDPDINAYVQEGVTLSDEIWQMWLDETLEEGMNKIPYKLMIVDTLMMTAGEVDENRAQEMTTKIFRPMKLLARKHNVALMVVHHLGKSDKQRMGQRMLGSVANHAWAEDSLYLQRAGRDFIRMELESKVAPGQTWKVGNLNNERWEPSIGPYRKEDDESLNSSTPREARKKAPTVPAATMALMQLGGVQTAVAVAEKAGLKYQQAYRQLCRDNNVEKNGNTFSLKEGAYSG